MALLHKIADAMPVPPSFIMQPVSVEPVTTSKEWYEDGKALGYIEGLGEAAALARTMSHDGPHEANQALHELATRLEAMAQGGKA